MQMLLPMLRADFAINDTDAYGDGEPLDCHISCFGGLEDEEASGPALLGWRDQTRGAFDYPDVPRRHFFIQNAQEPLLSSVESIRCGDDQGGKLMNRVRQST